MNRPGNSLPNKNIFNLADRIGHQPGLFEMVEQGWFEGNHRKIVAVRCPLKVTRLAEEGPGNDPADLMLASQNFPRHPANLVQLLQWYNLFMGRNLKDAVPGGVDDDLPGAHVFFAQLVDNDRP